MTNILLNLNLEHHIERHYEIETNKSTWLQQIDVEKEFFEDRLNHCLKIPEDITFNEFISEEFGLENAKEDFEYLQNTTFTNFFKSSSVDVPSYNSAALTKIRKAQKLKRLKLTYYYLLRKNNFFTKKYTF